jgi:general secretion pathway protein L
VPGAAQSAAALAWAHALRGQSPGGKGSRFNFRKGEFAFKSDLDFMGEKVGQLVAFAAVLLVLLVAGGIVRNTVLERRAKQIDAMLCETTQRVLGTCEKDYSRAINMMKGQEGPGAGVPKRSAATLLAEITQRVPASLDVTFEELTLDLDRVSLRCQAPSSKDMEDIITALKTYRCFSNVKEGKVEKTKDGTKIAFRLDIEVECPDDAPATQG